MVREWLGAMLRGDNPRWGFPADMANETISDEANSQGVVALLHEKISAENKSTDIPAGFREHIAELARKKAQQSLMREAECRRILASLQQAGIHALLLKGSALAYWLYPSAHLRDCSDIDLLFSSHDETRKAISLLQSMQYSLRDPALAGDLVSFE
ncbi:MAG: nucleotidyltransferase family protein, partial [Arenimonas sp.]